MLEEIFFLDLNIGPIKPPTNAPKFDAERYPNILKINNKIPININSKKYLIFFIIFFSKNQQIHDYF